jgi:serine/threonine protein kinase
MQRVTAQLCHVLAWLHARDVVHNDIKPSNILYAHLGDDPLVKLSDFGLARRISCHPVGRPKQGTPEFMAPELWVGKPVPPANDVWALGITLVELCTGEPFTPNPTDLDLAQQLQQLLGDDVLLCDLLCGMLQHNPAKRITANGALRHQFFQ